MCFLFIGQILGVHERDELPPSAPMVSCLVLCPPRTGSELQAFFGEVLPEAWPPRIIPRDDQQVFRCFIGFFLLRSTDKNLVAALEINDLWQLSMINLLLLFYG